MSQFNMQSSESDQPSHRPPYGPPPARRRGRWAVLAAAVVTVSVAVGVGVGVLLRAGDGDGTGGSTDRSYGGTAISVAGDGYSYHAPSGWLEIRQLPTRGDTGTSPSGGLLDPVLVMVGVEPVNGPAKTPMEVWSAASDVYLEDVGKLPTIHRGPRLDGRPTLEGRIEFDDPAYDGAESHTFYVVEHAGRLYSITVMATADRAAEADAAFDEIAASWFWR